MEYSQTQIPNNPNNMNLMPPAPIRKRTWEDPNQRMLVALGLLPQEHAAEPFYGPTRPNIKHILTEFLEALEAWEKMVLTEEGYFKPEVKQAWGPSRIANQYQWYAEKVLEAGCLGAEETGYWDEHAEDELQYIIDTTITQQMQIEYDS